MSRGLKAPTAVVAVIGDVVSSRSVPDRAGLHRRLDTALADLNVATGPVGALRITVGDEFQGSWATLAEAVDAVLRLRLALSPQVDTRYGIGVGAAGLLDPDRRIEYGSAWWAARSAIDEVKRRAARSRTPWARTRLAFAEPSPDGSDRVLNLGLGGLDHLLGQLDEVSWTLLRGAVAGRTQTEMAAELGMTQSAVSQRMTGKGLWFLIDAHRELVGAAEGMP